MHTNRVSTRIARIEIGIKRTKNDWLGFRLVYVNRTSQPKTRLTCGLESGLSMAERWEPRA